MTKEDEEEYLNFCSEAMFRIHILEQRLNRYLSTGDVLICGLQKYWYPKCRRTDRLWHFPRISKSDGKKDSPYRGQARNFQVV